MVNLVIVLSNEHDALSREMWSMYCNRIRSRIMNYLDVEDIAFDEGSSDDYEYERHCFVLISDDDVDTKEMLTEILEVKQEDGRGTPIKVIGGTDTML
jgi:hypothetical protein